MAAPTDAPKLTPRIEHRESIASSVTMAPSPPKWERVPYPISRFLGYRKAQPGPQGGIVRTIWSFAGILISISIIEVVSRQVPMFREHGGPIIVGSFGAAAVLEFHAIESPLAQPRNAVLSQLIASVVGVGICKLFKLHPHFQTIRWIAGALSCAVATALMALTGTVHPPAGATALIAVVDDSAEEMGWYLIVLVMLGCAIMLLTALILNNIQRRFPIYWWTPGDLEAEVLGEDPRGGLESTSEDPILMLEEGRRRPIQKD